ncbi:DUF1295-domain-containing protein [Neoconidiobolus thromboides FSU 785]|nr:DUF1295-domain-containing protein [Neoconidiobolus thromboides FSU 785]
MDLSHNYFLKDNYLATTLVFTVLYQLSFFAVAYVNKFDKVTDFAGGSNFVLLAGLTFFLNQNQTPRSQLATIAIILWGIRISGFLLYRILKTEEDKRFDELRNDFWKFLGFWIFQMAWVWTVSLPVTVVNLEASYTPDPPLNLTTDILGILMFLAGLIIETISDIEKFMHRESKPKPTQILNSGLWKYSRHPNYFGEILLWWGIYVFSLPITSETGVLTISSPLFITLLLLFVSGIPLSEPNMEKKFIDAGKQSEYIEYIDKTSPLIPLPNMVYKSLPRWTKFALFEFPMYRYKQKAD